MDSRSPATLQSHWTAVITLHRCLVFITGACLVATILSGLRNHPLLLSSKSRYKAGGGSSFHACTKINSSSGYNPEHHISLEKVCDGKVDCPLGDDEVNCTSVSFTRTSSSRRRRKRSAEYIRAGIEQLDIRNFQVFDASSSNDEIPDVLFIVYKRSNPSSALDPGSIAFGSQDKVVFYIHGYATDDLADGLEVKDGLFSGTSDVDFVVIVDWRKLSVPLDTSYFWPSSYETIALTNVPFVASLVKDFLVEQLGDRNFVYIVGFSLGAQIAGTVARTTASDSKGFSVDRVTGLDPAGAIFEYSFYGMFPVDTTNTIRPSDASFVDIIHTSSALGMGNPAGDVDTFAENSDCILPTCSHRKSLEMFVTSLTKCAHISCPREGECTPRSISSSGYLADKYEGRGVHDLLLDSWTDPACSHSMNIHLPAKERICLRTSNLNSPPEECVGLPYLLECTVECYGKAELSVCSNDPRIPIDSREDDVPEIQWQCSRSGRSRERFVTFRKGFSRQMNEVSGRRRRG